MNELNKRIITSFILILLLSMMFIYSFIFISTILIAATIIWIEFKGIFIKIYNDNYLRFLVNIFSLAYIFYFVWISLITLQTDDTKILWFYSILVCIMSDIGGFIFGKTFKGPKLTKISPNKTIAGMLGAFVLSLVFMYAFSYIFDINNFIKYFIITIIVSGSSQLGDIFISYLKRKAKLKNTSNILPGHGGLLDRVDGILFGIPIGLNLVYII